MAGVPGQIVCNVATVRIVLVLMAKLQFMVWGSGAPGAPGLQGSRGSGAPGAPGLPGLRGSRGSGAPGYPADELVMYSKSEMACFAKGKKIIFQISVLISKCQL